MLQNKVIGKAHIDLSIKCLTTYKYTYDIDIQNPKTIQELLLSVVPALNFYLEKDKKQKWFESVVILKDYSIECEITVKSEDTKTDYIISYPDFKKAIQSEITIIKEADIISCEDI